MEVCATFPVTRGIMACLVMGLVNRIALWKNVIQCTDVNQPLKIQVSRSIFLKNNNTNNIYFYDVV